MYIISLVLFFFSLFSSLSLSLFHLFSLFSSLSLSFLHSLSLSLSFLISPSLFLFFCVSIHLSVCLYLLFFISFLSSSLLFCLSACLFLCLPLSQKSMFKIVGYPSDTRHEIFISNGNEDLKTVKLDYNKCEFIKEKYDWIKGMRCIFERHNTEREYLKG